MKFPTLPKIKTLYSQIIIGFVGGIIDFALLMILSKFINFVLAFLVGISIAILINYVLTIRYSFKSLSKFETKEFEIFNYYIGYIFTISIQIIIMYIFNFFNFNLMIGKIVAIICGFVFSILLKFYLFLERF